MSAVERLRDAEAALHALLTGTAAVEVSDQNGERVKYNQASAPRLQAYVDRLRAEIAGRRRRSSYVITTSKGL
ncbi:MULTISPECIES: gpW family head-tail joining protein [Brevundimonas]|uniref:gpW family head-tail joining protein n=1 Tax=Brevundimonas TaxID=41275 RepID=UPI0034D6181C